jgi:DNA-binding NarL/FixJ family response regulator
MLFPRRLPRPLRLSKPAPAPGDTVKLSEDAQIHLMQQQGQGAPEIASDLGISVATVDDYLGVSVPSTASSSASSVTAVPVSL